MEHAALGPISPELVLVCPELAGAARAALPDRDPDASVFSPRPRAAAEALAVRPRRVVWRHALAYAGLSIAGLALRAAVWVALLAAVVTVPLLLWG